MSHTLFFFLHRNNVCRLTVYMLNRVKNQLFVTHTWPVSKFKLSSGEVRGETESNKKYWILKSQVTSPLVSDWERTHLLSPSTTLLSFLPPFSTSLSLSIPLECSRARWAFWGSCCHGDAWLDSGLGRWRPFYLFSFFSNPLPGWVRRIKGSWDQSERKGRLQ